MDVPFLPPLPLPDGYNANNNAVPFLVRRYIIEGAGFATGTAFSCHHVLRRAHHSHGGSVRVVATDNKRKYTRILTAMIRIHDGEPVKLLRSIYPQIYKWYKKNMPSLPAVTVLLSWHALTMPTVMPMLTRMSTWRQWRGSHIFEVAYSDIKRAHGQEHRKGRTWHARLDKHFDNIGCQPCKLFTNTCPICCDNRPAQHWDVICRMNILEGSQQRWILNGRRLGMSLWVVVRIVEMSLAIVRFALGISCTVNNEGDFRLVGY